MIPSYLTALNNAVCDCQIPAAGYVLLNVEPRVATDPQL